MVKGYDPRPIHFRYLTNGMKEIFKHVLADDSEAAINFNRDDCSYGQVPVRDLIMSKSCKGRWDKEEAEWVSPNYANPDSMIRFVPLEHSSQRDYRSHLE